MSQAAIDYLKANKDKYSREVLAESLRQAGYEAGDISESIKTVYGSPEPTKKVSQEKAVAVQSYWDFRGVYIYKSKAEKIVDYIIGVFSPGVLTFFINIIDPYSNFLWVSILAYIIAIFYFRKRRRYLFHGLMLSIYIAIALIIAGALIFGLNFGNFF
jgi:hypothetical protein